MTLKKSLFSSLLLLATTGLALGDIIFPKAIDCTHNTKTCGLDQQGLFHVANDPLYPIKAKQYHYANEVAVHFSTGGYDKIPIAIYLSTDGSSTIYVMSDNFVTEDAVKNNPNYIRQDGPYKSWNLYICRATGSPENCGLA